MDIQNIFQKKAVADNTDAIGNYNHFRPKSGAI